MREEHLLQNTSRSHHERYVTIAYYRNIDIANYFKSTSCTRRKMITNLPTMLNTMFSSNALMTVAECHHVSSDIAEYLLNRVVVWTIRWKE